MFFVSMRTLLTDVTFKLTMESRSWKVGSSDATSNALQNTDKEQWRNPRNIGKSKAKYACVCRCRRIYL